MTHLSLGYVANGGTLGALTGHLYASSSDETPHWVDDDGNDQALLAGNVGLYGGRLSPTTTPVPTTNYTGVTGLYLVPHIYDLCPLWNGSNWQANRRVNEVWAGHPEIINAMASR